MKSTCPSYRGNRAFSASRLSPWIIRFPLSVLVGLCPLSGVKRMSVSVCGREPQDEVCHFVLSYPVECGHCACLFSAKLLLSGRCAKSFCRKVPLRFRCLPATGKRPEGTACGRFGQLRRLGRRDGIGIPVPRGHRTVHMGKCRAAGGLFRNASNILSADVGEYAFFFNFACAYRAASVGLLPRGMLRTGRGVPPCWHTCRDRPGTGAPARAASYGGPNASQR